MRFVLALALIFITTPVLADQGLVDPSKMPEPLNEVRFDQRLGEDLPLDLVFTKENGEEVRLGDLFGDKPVVLSFVYYQCPMLCSLVLNGLAKSLGVLAFDAGREFDVIAVSIDPGESAELARQAKAVTVKRYGHEGTEPGWHFLTGSQDAIESLTAAAGFYYKYLPDDDEYAHASGIVIATPEGRIAQYFYGIEYPPKDVRLALVEASSNEIGSVVDQILLYCYRYDPQLGKYTAITMRIVRLAGAFFAGGLILFLWIAFRRERSNGNSGRPTLGALPR